MDAIKIEKYEEIAAALENFNDCYQDIILKGTIGGVVKPSTVLAWLIENPHMAEIAKQIHDIDKGIQHD